MNPNGVQPVSGWQGMQVQPGAQAPQSAMAGYQNATDQAIMNGGATGNYQVGKQQMSDVANDPSALGRISGLAGIVGAAAAL